HPEELKRLNIKNRAQWDAFYAEGKSLIKSKNEPGTDLIAIHFSWSNPVIAEEALEVVLHTFSEASLNLNRAEQEGKSKYLSGQLAQLEKQLQDVREKKSAYKEKMQIASLSQESTTLATTGIELGNQLTQVEADARGKEEEYLKYEKMLG